MKKNVGRTDRIIRITLGILLFPLLFLRSTLYKLIGIASIPLIVTGLTQRCGAYALMGMDTCERD
jgi:hypothetical protein